MSVIPPGLTDEIEAQTGCATRPRSLGAVRLRIHAFNLARVKVSQLSRTWQMEICTVERHATLRADRGGPFITYTAWGPPTCPQPGND